MLNALDTGPGVVAGIIVRVFCPGLRLGNRTMTVSPLKLLVLVIFLLAAPSLSPLPSNPPA